MTNSSPRLTRRRLLQTGLSSGVAGLGASLGLTGCVADPSASPTATQTASNAGPQPPLYPTEYYVQTALQPQNMLRPERAGLVGSMYQRNNFRPIWHDGFQWTPPAHMAFYFLINAEREGLLVRDYLPTGLLKLDHEPSRRDEIARVDVAMTDGFMRYLRDLTEGRDPNQPHSDGRELFDTALRQPDLVRWIESIMPRNPQYVGLKAALTDMRPLDKRRGLIAVNMERWRTLKAPPVQEVDVFVNIPTFHLEARRGGRTELDMPVVVGKQARQTPILTDDRIVNLKFSPDWGVPQTIEAEDIIPILQRKPELFAKMGLSCYANGNLVDVMTVDWNQVHPINNIFSFRQPPGPDAALGGVRFSLTNPYDIFLHDSPDRSKFKQADRAISSGCVRVGGAEDLATWLLAGQGWSRERVQQAMTAGRTSVQALSRPVPVTTNYFTAWVSGDGNVKYGMDVYGLDEQLAKRIDFGTPPQHPYIGAPVPTTAEGKAEEFSP